MTSLPINLVNLICEWAADYEQEWILFFCPKTGRSSYKVNNLCKKLTENGEIVYHQHFNSCVIEGTVNVNFVYLRNNYNINYKGILFQYGKDEFKMYIEFDSEKDNTKKEKYIDRAMEN
jgi:hypothetical protein